MSQCWRIFRTRKFCRRGRWQIVAAQFAAIVLAVSSSLQAVAAGEFRWDAADWPAPIQQAFAEAIVWNAAATVANEEAAAEATKQSRVALDRAFETASAHSPEVFASVLTAAAELSLSTASYRTQLRAAFADGIELRTKAASLEAIEQMLRARGETEAADLVDAFRRDNQRAAEAADDAVIRSASVLTGGLSEQHAAWCIEAVAADPECIPAWMLLATRAELEVRRIAVSQWSKRQPNNGASDIIATDLLSRDIAVDTTKLIARLESAAKKREVAWPIFRGPTQFDVHYPDAERFRDADVVGRRVSAAAIHHMTESTNLSGSVIRSLKNTLFYFSDNEENAGLGIATSPEHRKHARRLLALLAARIVDGACDSTLVFMRAETVMSVSLGLTGSDNDGRADLTANEQSYLEARRRVYERLRSNLERSRQRRNKENSSERPALTGQVDESTLDRETLTHIRAVANFEKLATSVIEERERVFASDE